MNKEEFFENHNIFIELQKDQRVEQSTVLREGFMYSINPVNGSCENHFQTSPLKMPHKNSDISEMSKNDGRGNHVTDDLSKFRSQCICCI